MDGQPLDSHSNLRQETVAKIVGLVARGELKPSVRLPPQREFAKQLGVGMSTLREALHALSAIGLIELQARRGTFVAQNFEGILARQAELAALVSKKEFSDLLEVRRFLEHAVVALACERATDQELTEIDRLCEAMELAVRDGDFALLEDLDLSFHLAITAAAHNDVLLQLAKSINGLFRIQIGATQFSEESLRQHSELSKAVIARDQGRAQAAVDAILSESASRLKVVKEGG